MESFIYFAIYIIVSCCRPMTYGPVHMTNRRNIELKLLIVYVKSSRVG